MNAQTKTQQTQQTQQISKLQTPLQQRGSPGYEGLEAFRRRSKIQHSPPRTLGGKLGLNERADASLTPPLPEINKKDALNTPTDEQGLPSEKSSPKQEFIAKMRTGEEEALMKCRLTLGKMKLAMLKQKNISIDVKNGVSELDELFDIIESLRRNWTKAEHEAKKVRSVKPAEAQSDPSNLITPTAVSSKRAASSPAEQGTGKRVCETGKTDWQTVTRKKTKKQDAETQIKQRPQTKKDERKPKQRSEAVLFKPAEGRSYAEVLQNLRQYVKSDENRVEVRAIRKTKTGALLLELDKGIKLGPEFHEALSSKMKDIASVSELKNKTTIEIRDLDSLTTADEVATAVNQLLGETNEEITVKLSAPNSREQLKAYVTLSSEGANKILQKERVKIGWINCKMRLCIDKKKCYRCFETGHLQWQCKGPDRKGKGLCIRCGKPGHKIKECSSPPDCCICRSKGVSDTGHMLGSVRCAAYNEIMSK